MHVFLMSLGLVALSEIGDKTQLLAFLLSARFQRPIPIIAAILLATIINHTMAACVGKWLVHTFNPSFTHWLLVIGFISMAIWMLIPDKLNQDKDRLAYWQRFGVFGATFVLFFLAEFGDKTQVATLALAARYDDLPVVITGTTLGIMITDGPAVFFGNKLADRLPINLLHRIAAIVFLMVGVGALVEPYL